MDRETLLERRRGIEWDDFEVKEAAGGVPKTAYTTISANTKKARARRGSPSSDTSVVITALDYLLLQVLVAQDGSNYRLADHLNEMLG